MPGHGLNYCRIVISMLYAYTRNLTRSFTWIWPMRWAFAYWMKPVCGQATAAPKLMRKLTGKTAKSILNDLYYVTVITHRYLDGAFVTRTYPWWRVYFMPRIRW